MRSTFYVLLLCVGSATSALRSADLEPGNEESPAKAASSAPARNDQAKGPANVAKWMAANRDSICFGLFMLLFGSLLVTTRQRHKREAQLRALGGDFLNDGTELAGSEVPHLLDPAFAGDPVQASVSAKAQFEQFLQKAPETLRVIRQALQDATRPEADSPRHSGFAKLARLTGELKHNAQATDMRPVWQITSALELLACRLVEKPAEATPSVLRTFAAAIDLLGDLCVRGIPPNLMLYPPLKILVADDDPLSCRAINYALEKANLTADVAENGRLALDLTARKQYDVIFLDISMPIMDGLEACAAIRKTNSNRNTPIVFVTAKSDFQTRAKSSMQGGNEFIAKPFLIFELTVRTLICAARNRLPQRQTAQATSKGATAAQPEGACAACG